MEELSNNQLANHVGVVGSDADEVGTLCQIVDIHGLDAVAAAVKRFGCHGAAVHVDHFYLHLAVHSADADGGGIGGGVRIDGAGDGVHIADANAAGGAEVGGDVGTEVVVDADGTHLDGVVLAGGQTCEVVEALGADFAVPSAGVQATWAVLSVISVTVRLLTGSQSSEGR